MKSMTGYGAASAHFEHFAVEIEMKSVNHRFLEIFFRTDKQFFALEDAIKKLIQSKVARGRFDIYLSIKAEKKNIIINEQLLEQISGLISRLPNTLPLSFSDLLNVDGAILVTDEQILPKDINSFVLPVVDKALCHLISMRCTEGEILKEDLLKQLNCLKTELSSLQKRIPEVITNYQTRLTEKLFSSVGNLYDEQRLLTEVAIFVDRADISEEITRLLSHFEQFFLCLKERTPIGRKLDFLLQEMNREVNTIGAKGNDRVISKKVVLLKTGLEKIREQVQNIE